MSNSNIPRKLLVVEVIEARNLVPKDGHGTSSPYAVLDFHGQRKKTRTVAQDLNPTWNETLQFNVERGSDVLGDALELDVFHDTTVGPTTRNNFLGRVRLTSSQFVKKGEEALIYYPLEKKSLFSWIQGEIGLKIYFADDLPPPPPPPPLPSPPPEAAAEIKPDSDQAAAEVKPEPDPPSEAENNEPPPPPPSSPPPEPPAEAPPPPLSAEAENKVDSDSTADREELATTVQNFDNIEFV